MALLVEREYKDQQINLLTCLARKGIDSVFRRILSPSVDFPSSSIQNLLSDSQPPPPQATADEGFPGSLAPVDYRSSRSNCKSLLTLRFQNSKLDSARRERKRIIPAISRFFDERNPRPHLSARLWYDVAAYRVAEVPVGNELLPKKDVKGIHMDMLHLAYSSVRNTKARRRMWINK